MENKYGQESSPPLNPLPNKRVNRPLSIASRMWVAVDELYPPYWTGLIFEGHGSINQPTWQEAIHIASEANLGSRLVLKGHLANAHWVDSGQSPLLRVVDGRTFDGMSSEGLLPLLRTSDVRQGPNAEVLLLEGDPLRIMFRAHHALMDFRGTLTWVEDIFRVLKGLVPIGSDYLTIENDLLHLPDKNLYDPPAFDFIAPTGPADLNETGFIWRRFSVKGNYSKLLPRLMILTARAAWRHQEGPVRFGIPVDLRSRQPGLRSTSNLANAIYITVRPESTVDELAKEMQQRLKERNDGKLNWEDKLIPYVPIKVLKRILQKDEQKRLVTNKFRFSGVYSNGGRMDLEPFTGGGFIPSAFFALPTAFGSLPFSVGISGHHDITEYVFYLPQAFASQGRLEEIIDYIFTELDRME
ncbi:MAG: hypothetical protein ACM3QW_05895 [Ignavibacteriales bacterium]